MANLKSGRNYDNMRKNVLYCAATLFLEQGFTATTVKSIATKSQISIGSLVNLFKSKEDILCELVNFVLEGQFSAADALLEDIPHDTIEYYGVETTLQLYMVESHEHIRELYTVAYSLPKTSQIIQRIITGKLEQIFKPYRTELETKDFYKLEIASGGVMRGFMTVPCDMWFTMDQKVASFLESTFLIYRVPDEKIKKTIAFVSQFDYPTIAKNTIDDMLQRLAILRKETPIDSQ